MIGIKCLERFNKGVLELVLVTEESVASFFRNKNFQTSAALAYYGLFAIIPLLLLAVYVLSHYIASSSAVTGLIERASANFMQGFDKVILKEVFALSRHKNVWGSISIVALFWAAMPLGTALRASIATIFKIENKRHYLLSKLFDALAVAALLLMFVSMVVSEMVYSKIVAQMLVSSPRLLYAANTATPLIVSLLLMIFFYWTFIPAKIRLRHMVYGAFSAGFLLTVIRPVFSTVISFNPEFGYAFGSLKAIFFILLWIYYAFLVILFSAEFIANLSKKQALILKGLFVKADSLERRKMLLLKSFVETYEKGRMVFDEGQEGQSMFYILSGSVRISKNDQTLKVLKEGEYFGEMSMLMSEPRTASAFAEEDNTQLVSISTENFNLIIGENPQVVMTLLKEMAVRLKATSENV